jgi:hypothetical protein
MIIGYSWAVMVDLIYLEIQINLPNARSVNPSSIDQLS